MGSPLQSIGIAVTNCRPRLALAAPSIEREPT
jgi:hypothetical protein